MSENISLFLIAAVNDEYRTFSIGGFRPDDAILAKIEKELNSKPVDTPIRQVATINDRTSHPENVDFWALKIDRPTGGRPGRQLTLAIRHAPSITSAQINNLIDELDGIAGLTYNFYSTDRDNDSAHEWLKMLASNLQFSLKTTMNDLTVSNKLNQQASPRKSEQSSIESYGNSWVDSNEQYQQVTSPDTKEEKQSPDRQPSKERTRVNPTSNPVATTTPSRRAHGTIILLQLIILILLVGTIVQNEIIIPKHLNESLIVNDQNYGALDHNLKIRIADSKVYVNGNLREPVKANSKIDTKEDLQREVSRLRQENESLQKEIQRLNQQPVLPYLFPDNRNINHANNDQSSKIDQNH